MFDFKNSITLCDEECIKCFRTALWTWKNDRGLLETENCIKSSYTHVITISDHQLCNKSKIIKSTDLARNTMHTYTYTMYKLKFALNIYWDFFVIFLKSWCKIVFGHIVMYWMEHCPWACSRLQCLLCYTIEPILWFLLSLDC